MEKIKTHPYLITHFKHFGMQLSYRYNIFISYQEYLQLSEAIICLIGRESRFNGGGKKEGFIIGHVMIQGVQVLVVKKIRNKCLVTALPLDYNIKRFSEEKLDEIENISD